MHRILALGDSYTIGEGVDPSGSWPAQLRSKLEIEGFKMSDLPILARTGWTTEELDQAIQEADINPVFDMVTLQIGVNDQYRGYPLERFQKGYIGLIQQALGFADERSERVVAVSIPDWGVTPFAMGRDVIKIAKEIDLFNAAARSLASEYGLIWIDVTEASRAAGDQADLLASDGLHPSALQYKKWVELISPTIMNSLSTKGA